MGKTGKKILGAVVAVAAVFFTGGTAALAYIGKALVTAAVSIGVSRLIAKRANTPADAGGSGGARIQLPPATSNKLPVIYGSAFVGGSITDAMLSTDQKTMWYVIALAEVSDNQGGGGGSYTYDTSKIYYDGKLVQFGTNGAVSGLYTNNADPSSPSAQLDTRMNGFLYIYLFTNGSSSGVNTGGQTAAQILSTTNGVPAAQAWGVNQAMTNCAFAIVKVIYNQDAQVTSAGSLMVNISNSINKPGDAILDYMLNNRYGCALPISLIDTTSLTALNTYSDELITYNTASGSPPTAQQARYRINGPLDTGQSCLNNLQFLVDSCDSWLQYSELTGKWRVVINKRYTGYPTVSTLFAVDSYNLVGGIDISPIDLNETYNQVEVAYPNANIKDQTDYQVIDLFTDYPTLLSPNEAVNRLNITLPLVNNAVQAKYLGVRRILQSREDLVIAFRLDFSGIQLEAGDVIRVTHEVYGWTDKLFRVNVVAEEKDSDGNIFANIQAFEYNDTVYADDPVTDFIPAFNTGLKNPNVIGTPGAPTLANNPSTDGQVKSFTVTTAVPDDGIVMYMDVNYGNTSNVQQHILYRTLQQSNGVPFTNSTDIANTIGLSNVSLSINDIPAGNYYFSTTARSDFSGTRGNASAVFNWVGANLNANSTPGNVIQPNTLSGNTLIANTVNGDVIIANTVNGNVIIANTVDGNVIIANTINGNSIIANTINGNSIIANTIDGNTIIANTMAGNRIVANTASGNTIIANTLSGNTVIANTLNGNSIIANTVNGNVIINQTLDGNAVIDGSLPFTAVQTGTSLTQIIGLMEAGTGFDPEFNLATNFYYQNAQSSNYYSNGAVAYLDGNYPGANYLYPFYQGTSTTANGYLANSTGRFTPVPGADQIGSANTGTDGFYIVGIIYFGANTLGNLDGFSITSDLQLVANIDSTVQIVNFTSTSANTMSILTQQMTTIELKANIPQRPFLDTIEYTPNMNSFEGGGVAIKNLTNSSRVYVVDLEMLVGKNRVV